MSRYDLAIFIGRMAPCHEGHIRNIQEAAKISKNVLVLFGSANATRDQRNPFTMPQRITMMLNAVSEAGIPDDTNMTVADIHDIPSNDLWAGQVQSKASLSLGVDQSTKKIAIVGYRKDLSSFYLDLFPNWDFIETQPVLVDGKELNATDIREALFLDHEDLKQLVPKSVHKALLNFRQTDEYEVLKEEYLYHKFYPEERRKKYPINDVTADSVVICSGHVLLIRRKNTPGKGKWALPGGFVQTNETVLDGALRELMEETKLKVPEKVIRGSIVDEQRFDNPGRSLRGRIMTFAFTVMIKPDHGSKLPKVQASDDAAKAVWVPISSLSSTDPGEFFEDHLTIINTMLNRVNLS